jgi:hypothetical protein
MMLAAVAIGVSHLVQSTRAGADYGLAIPLALGLAYRWIPCRRGILHFIGRLDTKNLKPRADSRLERRDKTEARAR